MFGIGGFELFLILLFGFLIFGPEKLPAIAKTIGKGIAKFKAAQKDMDSIVMSNLVDFENDKASTSSSATKRTVKKAPASKEAKEVSSNKEETLEEPSKGNKALTSKDKASSNVAELDDANTDASTEPKKETFSERKARYERERAAQQSEQESEGIKGASQSSTEPNPSKGGPTIVSSEKAQAQKEIQDTTSLQATPSASSAINAGVSDAETEEGGE